LPVNMHRPERKWIYNAPDLECVIEASAGAEPAGINANRTEKAGGLRLLRYRSMRLILDSSRVKRERLMACVRNGAVSFDIDLTSGYR
jgi:hypothetical protein